MQKKIKKHSIYIITLLLVSAFVIFAFTGCKKKDNTELPELVEQKIQEALPAYNENQQKPVEPTTEAETFQATELAEHLYLPNMNVDITLKDNYTPLEEYAIMNQDVFQNLGEIWGADIVVLNNNVDFQIDMSYITDWAAEDGVFVDPDMKQYAYSYMLLRQWNDCILAQQMLESMVGSPISVTFTYQSNGTIYAQNTFDDDTQPMTEEEYNAIEWPEFFNDIDPTYAPRTEAYIAYREQEKNQNLEQEENQ